MLGDKLGDNAQIEIIAAALGWPCERRNLRFREEFVFGKPSFKPSLYHVDLERSDPLRAPWPELILTIGRRPSMVAMWIREQSRSQAGGRAGGPTKVVLIGRPKRGIDDFALVIATPQYKMPARANVVHLDLPLMRADAGRIAAEAEAWRARLAELPRPITAVLVGGPTKPYVFDATVAQTLIDLTLRSAKATPGTMFVTTSRRTPPAVVAALREGLPAAARLFEWSAGASENPYLALLGLAERFVVTGDSISMMVEVAGLGRPLAIFPLPVGPGRIDAVRRFLAARLQPEAGGIGAWLGQRLYALDLIGYARELGALHDKLIESGLAVRLGEPFPTSGKSPPTTCPASSSASARCSSRGGPAGAVAEALSRASDIRYKRPEAG